MAISGITTNFIKDKGIGFVSQLANNSDSIAPMLVKDTLSNGAIVYTYSKDGGKDDAREKAIEEFGTGVVWLLMIPGIKKLIDKTIYPFFKLNPSMDVGTIISKEDVKTQISKNSQLKSANPIKKAIIGFFDDGINKEATKNVQENYLKKSNNPLLSAEKQIFSTLNDKNETAKSIFKKFHLPDGKIPTNAQMYKGLQVAKFLIATGTSAIALIKIIQFKQKTTQERIEKDFKKKNLASKVLVDKNLNRDKFYQNFVGKNKTENSPSFTGLEAFMTNPILNTSILDGVITMTRLAEARKGEKKEVALKEIFQLIFIYGLAKPIQMGFEKVGEKLKMPIGLDPKVLFDKDLKEKVMQAKDKIKEINAKNVVEEIYKLDSDHPLVELLENNGVLKTVQENGKKAISCLSPIKEKEALKSFSDINSLADNIGNLSKIKGFKLFSVFGNVIIAALAMGILQPKVAILMRKLLNNGDNRNPAIVAQEREMHKNGI